MDRDKYFDMGMQFMGHGKFEKAVKYFEKCLDLYETKEHKALCLNALGNALERDEQTKKAEETYKKAIEMDPNQKLFYNNLYKKSSFVRFLNFLISYSFSYCVFLLKGCCMNSAFGLCFCVFVGSDT